MNDKNTTTIRWGLGGFIWGVFIALASIPVAGGGHGWVSALLFGFLAIFTAPLAAVAWARRKTNGRKLAVVAVVLAVIADVALLFATLTEGTEFFFEVLSMAIIWLVLWGSWQALAVIVLFCKPHGNHS